MMALSWNVYYSWIFFAGWSVVKMCSSFIWVSMMLVQLKTQKCRILKYTVNYSRVSDFVHNCRACKNWQKRAPVKPFERNRRCLCHENLEHLSGKLRKLQDSVKGVHATYAYAKTWSHGGVVKRAQNCQNAVLHLNRNVYGRFQCWHSTFLQRHRETSEAANFPGFLHRWSICTVEHLARLTLQSGFPDITHN
jgi:hypothetical protein